MNATEKSKAAIAAVVSGSYVPSTEKTRHLWLAVASLVEHVKAAEHCAFLAMREIEMGQVQSGFEFNAAAIARLSEAKQQMIFIGSVVNGKK